MGLGKKAVVVGAGVVGISTAYYLAQRHGITDVTLLDAGQPMAFTSAQSGENYRNWWPHPAMLALTNDSIDLMETIAADTGNRINMTRRGYALVTRATDIAPLISQLHDGLQADAERLLRYHESASSKTYQPFQNPDWTTMPDGVDVVRNRALIQQHFPQYDPDVQNVIHIRRGGDISGQQLGSHMLSYLRHVGARRLTGTVRSVTSKNGFQVEIETDGSVQTLAADMFVNAAGPFASDIAQMLDVTLPVQNVVQQKIAFEDRNALIPRTMPFSIDLDSQVIDWTEEEAAVLRTDPAHAWLAAEMPGAIHCRPDGGDKGSWVKLGWAYNATPAKASWTPELDPNFPEIVLRGAARLNPALKALYGNLPRNMHHYGGWYTMTEENWPLIGPVGPEGSFINCAMSGFGTMAACGSGALCADWIAGGDLPAYAREFSMARYDDKPLMRALLAANKGVL
ncbi:MAG: NAD(P)/FAD-dependent oxidoreductase [Sedimentitalea sp.]